MSEHKPVPQQPEPAAEPKPKTVTLSFEEHQRLLDQAHKAEQYIRQLADLENTKKRVQREKEEFTRYAADTVVRQLLPIVDSLGQALVAVDKQSNPDAVIKGVHLIYRQLLGVLEKEGVKRIATVGERFDPSRHEAVGQVDATGKQADGTVAEEVQVGYMMHGKVLRPAMVRVAKHAAADTADASQQETS